jgi:hypothetical protein
VVIKLLSDISVPFKKKAISKFWQLCTPWRCSQIAAQTFRIYCETKKKKWLKFWTTKEILFFERHTREREKNVRIIFNIWMTVTQQFYIKRHLLVFYFEWKGILMAEQSRVSNSEIFRGYLQILERANYEILEQLCGNAWIKKTSLKLTKNKVLIYNFFSALRIS